MQLLMLVNVKTNEHKIVSGSTKDVSSHARLAQIHRIVEDDCIHFTYSNPSEFPDYCDVLGIRNLTVSGDINFIADIMSNRDTELNKITNYDIDRIEKEIQKFNNDNVLLSI